MPTERVSLERKELERLLKEINRLRKELEIIFKK